METMVRAASATRIFYNKINIFSFPAKSPSERNFKHVVFDKNILEYENYISPTRPPLPIRRPHQNREV